MAVETPYTTEARIVALVGQLGLDLRTDDVPDYDAHIGDAIDVGTTDVDIYLADFSQAGIAADEFASQCATFFAVRWLCQHRLNEPSAGVEKECERREKILDLIRTRRWRTRIPRSRRPGVVTSHTIDLRRFNNQVRVDRNRSTGVAKDYRRPTDPTSPDGR